LEFLFQIGTSVKKLYVCHDPTYIFNKIESVTDCDLRAIGSGHSKPTIFFKILP